LTCKKPFLLQVKGIDSSKIERKTIEVPIEIQGTNKDTYDYYLEGLFLEEIASKRNLTVETILRRLEKCHNNGQIVDWSRFVDSNKEKKILSIIYEIGAERLKLIKEALSDDISYEDIRMVIIKNR
jgi:ATP-dependent DNA helicase RecQ